MEDTKTDPPIPGFNLARIENLREKVELALIDFIGVELDADQFPNAVERVHAALPKDIKLLTVRNTLLTLAGVQLTKGEAVRTAWRLAGNTGRLRNGLAVPPWTMQTEKEWVPLQIVEVLPGKNYRNERGVFVHQRILAGTSCPLRIMTFWTWKHANWMSRNLGFTAPWKRGEDVFPYHKGIELTSMRLLGLMDPDLTKEGKPNYYKFTCTSGLLEWNKRVLRARNHTDPPCPEGFTHPCHQCFIGTDRCFAGCHPTTWNWEVCPECKQEAWCDPSHPRNICVDCIEQGR
jgi:hypothetical protein